MHSLFTRLVSAVALLSVVAALPSPVELAPRAATTACFTTHTGTLEGQNAFGLNDQNQMIWPAGSKLLNVELQACPNATYAKYEPSEEFYGARLVAVPQSGVGSNLCLTTIQSPTDSNIYYMQFLTCGSNISPPSSQAFVLDTDDFGHNIYHVDGTQYAGPAVNDTGPIVTSGTNLVKWRHTTAVGESYESLVVSGFTGK